MRFNATLCLIALVGCGGVSGTGDGPIATTISPATGSALGGTTVTVTGEGFDADAEHIVVVGDAVATTVTVVDDTTLTFVTPAGQVGTADVTIVNFAGSDTLISGFSFNEAAQAFSIDKDLILGAGGETVTIRGTGFATNVDGATSVRIGGAEATAVTVVDDGTITATTGPREAADLGYVKLDVTVTNNNGSSSISQGAAYTKPGLFGASDAGLFYADPETGFQEIDSLTSASFRKLTTIGDKLVGSGGGGQLISIDIAAGTATNGPQIQSGFRAITGDANGDIWVYINQVMNLVNQATGALTPMGAPDANSDPRQVCIADRDATSAFYMATMTDGLRSINKTTSAITVIRPLTGLPTVTDVLFCRSAAIYDGELYALAYERNINPTLMYLLHINVSTGAVSEIDRQTINSRLRTLTATPTGL